MAFWLCKSEPDTYSHADLVRDKTTLWDGITNATARIHLRNMKIGDRILFYHTGDVKAIVGEMVVSKGPTVDPATPDDPKSVVVEVKAAKAWKTPVTLAQIKSCEELATWDLIRIGRLSVVPTTPEQWTIVQKMRSDG